MDYNFLAGHRHSNGPRFLCELPLLVMYLILIWGNDNVDLAND